METDGFAEGLFLKNYLGTVSTVPKSRSSNQFDTKFSMNSYCGEDYRTCQSHSVNGKMPDCSKINYLKEKNANEIDFYKKEHNGIDSPKTFIRRNSITHLNQPENEKKREKKWTLGVFFRKKCKKNAEDISDDSEEDVKKNFVIRHKCKKEKKKLKVKSTANGFDMIIPPKKEGIKSNKNEEIAQLSKENDSKMIYQKPVGNTPISINNTPTRFIHRHPNNLSEDEKVKCNKECLQVSRNIRKNLNVSHVSWLNNENVEGRKCRKKVMARAEAKRDMICDDSSSEEYESIHSNSSLSKNNVDQLGARKLRRNKRLSRNDSFSPKSPDIFEKEDDLTLIKPDIQESIFSDLKKNTLFSSVEQDDEKLSVKNHSKTISVIKDSQKQQIIDPVESCQTSTFPFVHCLQKSQNSSPSFPNLPVKNKLIRANRNQSHKDQSCISYSFHENQDFLCNKESRQLGSSPESLNAAINSQYKKLSNSDPFFSIVPKEKDWTFSQDNGKANFKNFDTKRLQEQPIKEYTQISINSLPKPQLRFLNFGDREKLEIFEKKTKENEIDDFYFHRTMLPTFENRANITASVSTEIGNAPDQLTKMLQRSGSEHFFGDSNSHKSFEQNRSSSYQNIPISIRAENKNLNKKNTMANEIQTQSKVFSEIPSWNSFEFQTEFSPKANYYSNENSVEETASMLRYYADLNPRSRNPIHITCDPAIASHEFLLNYPQMANKPKDKYFSKQSESSASSFLKVKDQEVQLKCFATQQKNLQNTYKPSNTHGNVKLSRSRSNSLKSAEVKNISFSQPLAHDDGNTYESQSQLKNLSLENDLKDNCKVNSKLEPPIRTLTQQESLIHMNKNEHTRSQSNKLSNETEFKNCNSNLSDALNELENIYNGLKFKDENLISSEPTKNEEKFLSNENPRELYGKAEKNFDAQSHVFTENLPVTKEFVNSSTGKNHVTLPVNKPGKISDDMAFRRMNIKDRSNAKTFISPSYLRFSFTSPEYNGGSPTFRKKPPTNVKEPDVTYDDVVFRNIRHANNTLKVLDPQPPFGIPIGIFTPAPCSNYLHAVPKERFRPSFIASKTPDVVKDDLAFRNLRKDNKSNVNLPRKDKNYSNLLKKRAVRSLSANISNIMDKRDVIGDFIQSKDNIVIEKKEEKTQSLTNLANDYESEQKISEKRLKELKEIKNNEFFEKFLEIKNKTEGNRKENLSCLNQSKSIEEIKNFDLNTLLEFNKSNNSDPLKKSNLVFAPNHSYTSVETIEKKSTKSPVVALSKYPAAAPSSESTARENTLDFFLNENKLENLLSVLGVNDSERQLDNLDSKPISENKMSPEDNLFSTAIEEFNKKFKTNSPDKVKRRRNLSLSNMNESKADDNWAPRTNSLERRRWPDNKKENLPYFNDLCESTKNHKTLNGLSFTAKESNSIEVSKNFQEILSEEALKEKIVECSSSQPRTSAVKKHLTSKSPIKFSTREVKLNSPSELKIDESHVKQNVDVKQYLSTEVFVRGKASPKLKDTFQEVYEYNCQLADKRNFESGNILIGKKNEKLLVPIEASNHKFEEHSLSDVELEFEKLHNEGRKSTKNTKENRVHLNKFAAVDNYIADITKNANRESSKESNFFLPFNEEGSSTLKLKNRGNTSEISSKREGEVKKDNLKTNLWLACTYALAFAFHFQQIDFLIALGTVLAVVLVIAILIL